MHLSGVVLKIKKLRVVDHRVNDQLPPLVAHCPLNIGVSREDRAVDRVLVTRQDRGKAPSFVAFGAGYAGKFAQGWEDIKQIA